MEANNGNSASDNPDHGSASSRGGEARARNLTPEKRSEIAQKAAISRWSDQVPDVMHAGILALAGTEIPCYVTSSGQRLLSGRGMQDALRLVDEEVPESGKKPGSRLTRLLNNKVLKPLILQGKSADHFKPIKCRYQGRQINGYDAELMADICDGMLNARTKGVLKTARQKAIADQCEILIRAFARVGITALVDEVTGYQSFRPRDALQAYLEKVIRSELAAWVKRFPDEFYENIYKLKGWTWPGMSKNRYSVVALYTKDLVYERLGPGIIKDLEKKNPVSDKGRRKDKHHQWLTDDVGHPMLAQHLYALIMLQRICVQRGNRWNVFYEMVNQAFPKKGDTLYLPFNADSAEAAT